MRTVSCAVLILVQALPIFAESQVSGPLLGWDFDQSVGAVRPVWGVPGAAWVGTPLEIGTPLARAAVSPTQDYILAEMRDESRLVLITVAGGAPTARDLAGVRPGQIAISPGGAYAAVYQEEAVQVIGGFPGSPAVVYEAAAAGPVTALAVSDTGTVLFGAEGVVFMATADGVQFLMPAGRPSAARFLGERDDALVADAAANTVYRVTASSLELLAAESDGISEPVAVGVSRDNRRAFVANSHANSIVVIELGERSISLLSAPAPVRSLEPLAGDSVFRLTAASQYPVWILDAGASALEFRFIPTPSPPVAPSGTENAQ
jgi:hypothetical protein